MVYARFRKQSQDGIASDDAKVCGHPSRGHRFAETLGLFFDSKGPTGGPAPEACMIPRLSALLLTLGLTIAIATPVFADNVMLVLDSSASMGGKLGRDRKIDLVADAILTAVADFPTEARIGLLAFGNKSKSSCSDAEVLVKPQANGNDLVAAAAATLQPRGKASLAVAVERAANALNYQKERATLVVFVDKVEACEADPCVLAESLKQKAHDLTVEVIGLGLDDDQIASVACMAEKTGGQFLNAKDGTDLAGGLAKALASAKAPPANLPSASLQAPASVAQSSVFEVQYDGPKVDGDRIQIVWPGLPPGAEIRSALVVSSGKARKLTAPAEAGTYEIRYYHPELNAVLATRPLEVTTMPVTVAGPASTPAGGRVVVNWTGPAATFDEIRIAPVNSAVDAKISSTKVVKGNRSVTLDAPLEGGSYEIRYHLAADDTITAKAPLTVEPPSASVKGPASAAAGSKITVNWTGPASRYDDVVIARSGASPGDKVATVRVRPYHPTVQITVPTAPGSYELRYIAGDGHAIFASAPISVQ
jgi:Ca-activated chloride channel family protein